MSDAYEEALRLLSHRALTRREVEERLAVRGHLPSAIEAAVARLTESALLDDRALARAWITAAASARGRGRDRAVAELCARGVDEGVAAAAWSEAAKDGAIDTDALLALAVRRRLGASAAPVGKGRLARVYNALLSEGFAVERIEAALVPYGFERNDEA